MKHTLLLVIGSTLLLSVFAQAGPQATMVVEPASTFRVNVISRIVKTVNYQHRSGATKLDFAATGLMPSAKSEAKVVSNQHNDVTSTVS